jgi:hypothetical protein
MVANTMLPAIKVVAREEADTLYANTYASTDSSLNSSITICTNATKPGFRVRSWIRNDMNMLTSPIGGPESRFYPTGLKNILRNGDVEMGFRASYPEQDLNAFGGTFELASMTWTVADQYYWGMDGNDEFGVTVDSGSMAKSVTPRIRRVVLNKKGGK